MPPQIPECVISVYLSDGEAAPLHDCEVCGFAVPVRPNHLHGLESEPEQEYFPNCPICGGRTGLYYFWSRQGEPTASNEVRMAKPR